MIKYNIIIIYRITFVFKTESHYTDRTAYTATYRSGRLCIEQAFKNLHIEHLNLVCGVNTLNCLQFYFFSKISSGQIKIIVG